MKRVIARIVAEALNEQGYKARFLDATDVICVKRELGNTLPDIEKCRQNTKELLLPLFDNYEHIIVPGFIASGTNSEVVTLGRGGSDYSATILADCVGANSVTLFKEVDGLLTADPRIVPHATVIPQLHYREAAELAYYGANVLHPRTIIPLLEKQIPLIIKNSFSPEFQGSVISSQVYSTTYPVKALTAAKQQSLITIEGNAMLGVPGIAGRAFAALAQGGISVSLISQASSEANICFIVPFQESQQACDLLKEVFFYEIKHNQISAVSKQDHLAVVAVVGMGMKGAPGTASRTFTALAEKQINIITIAQGSSELNISFVIEEQHLENALLALHQEYQLDKLYPLPDRKGKKVEISIHGFGHIGTTLVQQMVQQREYLQKNYQIECGCISIADRSGILTAKSEFGDRILTEYAEKKQRGISLYAHRDDSESGSFDQSYQNSTFFHYNEGIFCRFNCGR
ncbi:MAG: aspartate kinase [Bdellovibrionota bacterium]